MRLCGEQLAEAYLGRPEGGEERLEFFRGFSEGIGLPEAKLTCNSEFWPIRGYFRLADLHEGTTPNHL